jgi:ABC-type uncharacterized transport system permease subunit
MSELWRWVPPLLYGLAAVMYGRRLRAPNAQAAAPWLGPVAVGAHLLQLCLLSWSQGRLPFGTMWEALSLSTLVLSGAYLLVERMARSTALGAPFFLLAALGSSLAAGNHEPARWPVLVQSTLFAVHVALGVVGIGLLAASGLLAAGWLLLYQLLRGRRFGEFTRTMPDLATLDRLFFALSSLGTILLACAAVLGLLWMHIFRLPVTPLVSWKMATVLLVLVWYAAIPLLRQRRTWSSGWIAWVGFLGLVPLGLMIWTGTRAI